MSYINLPTYNLYDIPIIYKEFYIYPSSSTIQDALYTDEHGDVWTIRFFSETYGVVNTSVNVRLFFLDGYVNTDLYLYATNPSLYIEFSDEILAITGAKYSYYIYKNGEISYGEVDRPVTNQLRITSGQTTTTENLLEYYSVFNISQKASVNYRFYLYEYNQSNLLSDLQNNAPTENKRDPYSGGGTSGGNSTEGTGGTGTLDGTSDSIDFPSLPTLSASNTGFITIFAPTNAQLNALADYMWNNDLFDLDTWKKVFDNPMDAIIGLSIVPVSVPTAGSSDVTVGNILTTVSMTRAESQFVEVDCGTINVQEYWGAYLDYSPYTKCELYLPYCGVHPINTDDIMGKAVHIKYHVDILSGSCVCYVKCGDSVLYSYIGQCSSSIPITGQDMTQVINGALNIAGSIGSLVATGGMSAPIAARQLAGTASSTVSNVMNMKPTVERSGSLSGTGGMMAIQKPYLVVTRPRQCLPTNQNQYTGYPSYITRTINTLSGFTTFLDVHLTNIAATDAEKSEIMQLLQEGVIL